MERRVRETRYVPLAEARRLVEERYQEEDEAGIPLALTRVREYLREFGSGDPSLAVEAVRRLISELGLDEVIAVNLVNICPGSPGEVRSILAMRKDIAYDEELVSKILEMIRDYCSTVEIPS